NASMNRRKSAAPSPKTMPSPNATTLRLISIVASSISSRTSVLACSATVFAAAPTPCRSSVSRVGMPSPVDPLGGDDPRGEAHPDNEPRIRPAPAALLRLRARTAAELRARRRDDALAGLQVGRRVALRPRFDLARLQLAQECCV